MNEDVYFLLEEVDFQAARLVYWRLLVGSMMGSFRSIPGPSIPTGPDPKNGILVVTSDCILLRLFQHTELEHIPSNLYQRAKKGFLS